MFCFMCSILHSTNVCRNTCNDGGCEYTDKKDNSKKCDCQISKGLRTGDECEVYVDACENNNFPPCQNNGKCVSSLGYAYCDCPIGYNGPHSQCKYSKYLYRYLFAIDVPTINVILIKYLLIELKKIRF